MSLRQRFCSRPLAARVALVLLACTLACACSRAGEEAAGRSAKDSPQAPDVLLVTIDTLRADHLSAYGYERRTSPNLDRLASEGALFEVAYAPGPATTPSHATLLTSLYPLAHGVLRNGIALGGELPTLPALLAEQGYRTAAFVSSFPVSREFGLARGFLHFDDRTDDTDRHPRARRKGADGEQSFARLGERTIDAALAWLATEPADVRRFVWVHLFDPHAPYHAPPPYDAAFKRAGVSPRTQRIDAYDGEILYADAQLGRLVDAFAHGARARGVLTIVTADHGEAFGEHGRQGHNWSVFEEEVRVPLVLHWPGVITPGLRVAAAAHLVDVLPTVVSAARIDPRGGRFAGVDLLPTVTRGEPLDAQRAVFLQRPYYEDPKRARRRDMIGLGFGVRQGSWKYVEALEEGRRSLFDLATDPGESRDLAPEDDERASRLAATIATWRTQIGDGAARAPLPPEPKDVRRKLRALGYVD